MKKNERKESHQFHVDLSGLNLNDQQLQNVNLAVQKAVMTELARFDLPTTQGGFISKLRPPLCGIWYRPEIENILEG